MYKANQDTMFVPTKTISVKPEAQVDYTPSGQSQVRWLVPKYLGFFDPRGTMLKYKLAMSGRGYSRPDGKAGVHSLWRDLRIRDGSGSTELETIQDYNVLTASWWDWTSNDSIENKRDLFEGRSMNSDIDNSAFYSAPGDWTAGDVTASRSPKTLEIEQPIHSGILGGDKVFPVIATQGLRFEMTLDRLQRSLVNTTSLGVGANWVESKTAKLVTDDVKTAIGDEFTMAVKQPADAATGRGINRVKPNNNPFDIGDALYISDAPDGAAEELLGIITKFGKDGDGDLVISYIPARAVGAGLPTPHIAGDRIFYKTTDRINGKVVADVPAAQIAAVATTIGYTISDIELLLLQVQPPSGYVDSLMKQVSSSTGMSMDFRTWQLYRVNVTTRDGLTDQLIPARQRRGYSVLSVPLDTAKQNTIESSSLTGVIDQCQDYQYVHGGSLIPDRPISLVRYTQTPARVDALHLIESEKALSNAAYSVRNLLGVPDKFVIGRGFSKYGQVYDFSAGDLSLRVTYDAAQTDKVFEHFTQFLKRVNISSAGIVAME